MVVINRANKETQASVNAYVIAFIANIDDLKDVVIRIQNNHATKVIKWKCDAWRVPSISSKDSGRSRHPTTIPSNAEAIQVEETIAGAGTNEEEPLVNAKCFTHVAVQFKSSVADNPSDDVDMSCYGRLESF